MCPNHVANQMVAMSLAFPAVMVRVHVHYDADAGHHSRVHAVPDLMISDTRPSGLLSSGEPV